jgi:hypothetical protein
LCGALDTNVGGFAAATEELDEEALSKLFSGDVRQVNRIAAAFD